MNHFQRLKDVREDKDITQKEAAEYLQISQTQLSRYELGKQMMGIDKYIKLAKFYNVSLDYLAGITDKPVCLHTTEQIIDLNNQELICTISYPNGKKEKKKLTPKQAELLKKYLEILTK